MKGERELVRDLIGRLEAVGDDVEVGPGDDAAVVRMAGARLVITTDSQREQVHYRPEWISPADLGGRAWAVAASDVAAMGARPRWAVAALGVPAEAAAEWSAAVMGGMSRTAARHGCAVVGGDMSRSERAEIVVTVLGELPGGQEAMLRSGARSGHGCWVAGRLGWAGAGCTLLERSEVDAGAEFVQAYRRPEPPFTLAVELSATGLAAAAMDVSDGLALDLPRMCEASGVGARVESDAIEDPALSRLAEPLGLDPRHWLLGSGDDYALLCAVPSEHEERFQALASRHGVPACRIGSFVDGPPRAVLVTPAGEKPLTGGWDPFADDGGNP